MNTERWSRIGELFDLTLSLSPTERAEWLRTACDGDDRLRAEVESLLNHDSQADLDGFLDVSDAAPQTHPQAAADPPPANHRRANPADTATPFLHSPGVEVGTDGFSPKAAIAHARPTRSEEGTRLIVQSRLRTLPFIHILIFGMVILVRPLVLGRNPGGIVIPFGIAATILAGIGLLLSAHHFSLMWLRKIELAMTLTLVGLLTIHEGRAILGSSLGLDPLLSERITRNTILLASLVMLIDAIYIPKSWRRTAVISSVLAMVPLVAFSGAKLIQVESIAWLGELRADGINPVAVFIVDTIFLLTLGAISSFATQTIARLRSEVVQARRFGQYRLGDRIGSGGMGEVFLAEHELLKRRCAVKLIRPEVVLRAGTIERFEREVRINATLSHPNTVEIFDYGRTEDGTYYYVMEYLPGMSLADLVERHGPLPPARAIYLVRQVALALVEAHEAGLIHRDIKPSNIFAARRGGMDDVAKLLDFGLVRPEVTTASSSSPRISDEGQLLGTPLYMSPEQATGSKTLDARSDIYSLGAVAYFLRTGQPPFDADTAIEAIIAHARDPVVPPSQLRGDVPDDLDSVILRCLAKDSADRFPTAEALEIALGRCASASSWDKAKARRWWYDGSAEDAMRSDRDPTGAKRS